MKRIEQIIGIRPEDLAKYKAMHDNIPSEIVELLRKANIRNYSISYHKGMLFAYMEYIGDNLERDMKELGKQKEMKKWLSLCEPLQRPEGDRPDGTWWTDITEVFHMD